MLRRISAIDIGSNAIRMMVAEVEPNTLAVKIIKKQRAPVRLGHDVFTTGTIGPHTLDIARNTFMQFANTNKELHVEQCLAIATSASREAKNRHDFVKNIEESSGIKIRIIDGTEEGQLIHLAVQQELQLAGKKTMLIDIGGGSVEVTFSHGEKIHSTKSFPMGTVRILENIKKRHLSEAHMNVIIGEFMPELAEHICTNTDHEPLDFAIGTGGNLECLGQLKVRMLQRTPGTFLTLSELDLIIEGLRSLSIKDRMEKLSLKADRADVIVPAAVIVQTIMRQGEVEKIMIPGVGLRDGIIWSMLLKRD